MIKQKKIGINIARKQGFVDLLSTKIFIVFHSNQTHAYGHTNNRIDFITE